MITVNIPQNYRAEREYILHTLLHQFLGINYILNTHDSSGITLTCNHKTLHIQDTLFSTKPVHWLTEHSLPRNKASIWDIKDFPLNVFILDTKLPVIYGKNDLNGTFFLITDKAIHLNLDVFGSSFFLLTGYEEFVKKERDIHGRFPFEASHAYQNQYVHRPLVNEYLEILWACMKHLWPDLERKQHRYQLRLTHDVDIPFRYAFASWKNCTKEMAKLTLNKQYMQALQQPYNFYMVKVRKKALSDPFNTFSFLMDIAEKQGISATFYFMVEHTNRMNADYSLTHPFLIELLKTIHHRGHQIGLHGSYYSYQSEKIVHQEIEWLKKTCDSYGITQNYWGNRQHYLRWDPQSTASILHQASINHDSTVGYAEQTGFRAGTCFDYYLYDLATGKQLAVIERPLVVMEASLLGYMNLNHEDAYKEIKKLQQVCKFYHGNFTLLWHNSTLQKHQDKDLFQACVND
ncbi:polysaccharide deacetylase family protein [Legionella oakridgensis]|uniref:DUF7033 domain-containing protein n=2 Tax=Legionella oakridgensis TaxID=29423 RepID=W0BG87_9GAMM|nr:polysaccharide deacetylase family protein [Legionella oakridgensis]AHE67637.1 hypothetical protein Loa_02093 [Legionella oakridgensis ATCC 33761 = DSM 21215]ETO92872.1 hypothetical protein LOR_61c15260 [Legionella oakridgensis RV-2-2007]KTD37021.1 hypothetical protein Loak_2157 [Legionella oakridgensis]STY20670.1 Uncharacterised protein [Legionella longbeachae]